ncbi:hypothetical protein RI367_006481 [Sorochytrium milnesiophthora]
MARVQPGQIVLIPELHTSGVDLAGKRVRVTGMLEAYNVNTNRAVLVHHGYRLAVDTGLLGVFEHQISSLCQFIGELERAGGTGGSPSRSAASVEQRMAPYVCRASVVRGVDGLDMGLYEMTVQKMRQLGYGGNGGGGGGA